MPGRPATRSPPPADDRADRGKVQEPDAHKTAYLHILHYLHSSFFT